MCVMNDCRIFSLDDLHEFIFYSCTKPPTIAFKIVENLSQFTGISVEEFAPYLFILLHNFILA